MNPPESSRTRLTLPFGVKIAALVTGLVALIVGGFGWVSAGISADLVEDEVNQRGGHMARLIAEALPRAAHQDASRRRWALLFEGPPPDVPEDEWRYRRQEEQWAWESTFARLARSSERGEILNVVLKVGDQVRLTGSEGRPFNFDAGHPHSEGIEEGVYRQEGRSEAARRFRSPVVSPLGDVFGELECYVSLTAVARARQRIYFWMGLLGISALFVGLVASLATANAIARPLRQLADDMKIVQSGQLGYRSGVKSQDEIGRLAEAFNEMSVGLKEAEAVHQEAERMRYEFQLASDIQRNLLPTTLPMIPGFEVAACYDPALQIGGDYYDLMALGDDRFAIVVADVSGKGISAGLIMSMTRSLVHLETRSGASAADLLRHVNALLYSDLQRGTFVTLLYLILNARTGEVTFASGGHNPILLWTPGRPQAVEVPGKGIALGVAKPDLFSSWIEEVQFKVPPGGRVTIYTDGVVEAKNIHDEEYGMERLKELAEEHATAGCTEFIERIREDVRTFAGGAEQSDDITVVTFRRVGS